MDFSHIDSNNDMVKRIIKSAFEVFALNDLKKASTNMIVDKAGISRGILYHYFKDKEELVNFLNYYAYKISVHDIERRINWDNADLIKRIANMTKFRLEVIAEYPYMVEYAGKYQEQMPHGNDAAYLKNWRDRFYHENIDYAKFKDQKKIKEVLHIVRWTFKGLYKELLEGHKDHLEKEAYLKVIKSCDQYYELLASNFYK